MLQFHNRAIRGRDLCRHKSLMVLPQVTENNRGATGAVLYMCKSVCERVSVCVWAAAMRSPDQLWGEKFYHQLWQKVRCQVCFNCDILIQKSGSLRYLSVFSPRVCIRAGEIVVSSDYIMSCGTDTVGLFCQTKCFTTGANFTAILP